MNMLSHITNNSGIYKITSPSGKIYIGEANNIQKRLKRYFRLENKRQYKLYNSFLKYGVENHVFEVVEECDFDNLLCRERYWQDFYDVLSDNGMNLKLTNCGDKKIVWSDDVKQAMIEKLKDGYENGTIINAFKGKKHTEETKKKLSEMRKGENASNFGKFGRESHSFGYRHTEEARKKMSDDRKRGKHMSAKIVLDTQTGVFHDCLKDLADLLKVNYGTLSSNFQKNRKNNTPYIYC